jgi:hypothetical protein
MSSAHVVSSGRFGRTHPVVWRRRRDHALLIGGAALAAVVTGCAVALSSPKPNFALTFGLLGGAAAVGAIASIRRLEVAVTAVVVYLGLLDGPVKLLSANQLASSARDVLIAVVSVAAILRIFAKRERLRFPPLTGWVAAFVALVLVEAFNPKTAGLLKIAGGFRQNLEWVPFFFFGYVLIRSRASFRKMFVILGVLTLVNGVVATYQTQISAASLSAWGPGYSEKVNGNVNPETGVGVTGRKYLSEGVGRVRPPGLGADSGFPGGLGAIALPGTLALLATGGRRRKWYAALLCLGALVAVAIGLGRLQVLGSVIAVASFAVLSLSAGKRVTKPLGALLAVAAIAVPLGALFITSVGSSVFSRYESIEPNKVVGTSTSYKEQSLALIPRYISHDPFGFGLATAGPAVGFGGKVTGLIEGHGVSAETQYNYVEDELGAPGLLLWVALSIEVIVLVLRRLPRVADVDIRIYLAAVFAVFLAHIVMGIRGAFMDSSSAGPFFWFSLGIAAYWFCGPGRRERAGAQEKKALVAA